MAAKTRQCILKTSFTGMPQGFVCDGSSVYYANGQRYIRDGNNPDRVEAEYAMAGGVYLTSTGASQAKPATLEQAQAFVNRLAANLEREKAKVLREAQARAASLDAAIVLFRDRLREAAGAEAVTD